MNNFAVHCLLAQVLGGFEPPISCLLDRRVKCWVTRTVAFRFFDLKLCVSVPSMYAI